MKYIIYTILVAMVLVTVSPVAAKTLEQLEVVEQQQQQVEAQATAEVTYARTCQHIASLAGDVMRYRQDGVAYSVQYQVGITVTDANSSLRVLVLRIIARAYEEPQWRSESSRQDAVDRFRSEADAECMSSLINP